MNYKIITDVKLLLDFTNWLPDLLPDEKFYCSLFARKKYHASVPGDKTQIKRFLATKENLFDKLVQLEAPLGSYKTKLNGYTLPVPQEALAVYIMPNPRSLRRATAASIKKFADLLYLDAGGYNPHAEVMSQIQVAKSRSHVVTFDFDGDIEKVLQTFTLDKDCYKVLKTRGGYHLMVESSKVKGNKTWFKQLSGYDQHGDLLSPIPGTYQGGFTPHFL